MGGDTFEGVQKLTNEEYITIIPEILHKLKNLYHKAEPYVPLPQKTVHGDIDFLIILKPGFGPNDIVSTLQMERFLINNNDTINAVYCNKQVDFCIVSEEEFEIVRFYKSYGGIGSFLGMFLPSKEIKLTNKGLFAVAYEAHIKFEYLLTKDVKEILEFYGMSYEVYSQGFTKRKQYFEYLRTCRFLDEAKFAAIGDETLSKTQLHSMGKLNRQLIEYLNSEGPRATGARVTLEDPKMETLAHFNKTEQFKMEFQALLEDVQRKKALNKKFNASHAMAKFNINAKRINKYKKIYHESFSDEAAYLQFIEDNEVEHILEDFRLKCKLDEEGKGESSGQEKKEETKGKKEEQSKKMEQN